MRRKSAGASLLKVGARALVPVFCFLCLAGVHAGDPGKPVSSAQQQHEQNREERRAEVQKRIAEQQKQQPEPLRPAANPNLVRQSDALQQRSAEQQRERQREMREPMQPERAMERQREQLLQQVRQIRDERKK